MTAKTAGVKCESRYLTMRDGVKIAVDLHLPEAARKGEKLPTIMRQTRYLRSVEFHKPFDAFMKKWFVDVSYETKQYFLARGYAWMDVDARGSGASFGHQPCPWHEDEVRDGADIVDWIISQPWSNGKVGATGVSNDGTTSEMLMRNRHPAVKAVIPQFCLFDAFTDVAFPGGIHQFDFTEFWSLMNKGFDRNNPYEFIGMWLGIMTRGAMDKKLDSPALNSFISDLAGQGVKQILKGVIKGVKPTDEDTDNKLVEKAVDSHAENLNVHQAALEIIFRDDGVVSPLAPEMGKTGADYFSPHTYVDKTDSSGTAVFSYGGWWDMAYQHAAIKRFMTLTNPDNRLMLGPWDHGGGHYIGPSVGFKKGAFDHNREFLRFFDYHLKGIDTGINNEKPIRYYTMGEEKWKSSDVWPPPNAKMEPFFFAADHGLAPEKPGNAGDYDPYKVDYAASTGHLSRWKSGLGICIDYSDRKKRDKKLLVYDSRPLERDMEVTGHPIVSLFISSDADDGQFFVYLEEVTPSGQVRYVTEGCLRAIHRKLSSEKPPYKIVIPYRTYNRADAMPLVPGEIAELVFDLLPTSYLFKKGNSIRVALAGADCDHSKPIDGKPCAIKVFRNKIHASHIMLPVIER